MNISQQIKNNVLLSDYIKTHMKLIQKNKFYWGLCPFHQEKTPSFLVDDQKQVFHCFGCGKHGDIFTFTQEKLSLDFAATLKLLAQEANVVLPVVNKRKHNQEYVNNITQQKKLLIAAHHIYRNAKYKQLIITYLKQRNIAEECYDQFQLGYSDNYTVEQLLNQNFSKELIKHVGVNSKGFDDMFRFRMIIPIFNRQNEIIGFGSRTLNNDIKPKYINSIESDLFNKQQHLYGENILEYKPIVLVEGYLDVITCKSYGYNAVGLMGTACSPWHINTIWRFTRELYIALDGDQAGQRGIHRSIQFLLNTITPQRQIYICKLENDPHDILTTKGKKSFDQVLQNAQKLHQYIQNELLYDNYNTPHGYAKYIEQVNYYTKFIKNKLLQQSYKLFWMDKLPKKQNISYSSQSKSTIVPKSYNQETIIMALLVYHPSLIESVIEPLSNCTLKDKVLEQMRTDILEAVSANHNLITINTILNNIYKKKYKELCDIAYFLCKNNAVFLEQYLQDMINTIQKENNNET